MELVTQLPGIFLRPLSIADAPAMAREAHSARIHEFVRDLFPYPYLQSHAEDFINKFAGDLTTQWAIAGEDCFCGVIGYHREEDVYRFSAEIGYWLGEAHWGRGLATAAIMALTEHLFSETDILRVYARVFAFNTASMRALVKAGYQREGVAVKHVFKNAQFWDEYSFYRLHPQLL